MIDDWFAPSFSQLMVEQKKKFIICDGNFLDPISSYSKGTRQRIVPYEYFFVIIFQNVRFKKIFYYSSENPHFLTPFFFYRLPIFIALNQAHPNFCNKSCLMNGLSKWHIWRCVRYDKVLSRKGEIYLLYLWSSFCEMDTRTNKN